MTRIAIFAADSNSAPWQAGVVRRLSAAGVGWDVFMGSGFGTFNAISMASMANDELAARSLEARWRSVGDTRRIIESGDVSEMLGLLNLDKLPKRLHIARSDFDTCSTTIDQVSETRSRPALLRLIREAMSVPPMSTKGNDNAFLLRSSVFTTYAPVKEILLQYFDVISVDVFCGRGRTCEAIAESGLLRGSDLLDREIDMHTAMSLDLSMCLARIETMEAVKTLSHRPIIRWWFSSVPATTKYSVDQWFDTGLRDSANKNAVLVWDP